MAIVNQIIQGGSFKLNRFGATGIVVFRCIADAGEFDALTVGDTYSIVQTCRTSGTGDTIPSLGTTKLFGVSPNQFSLGCVGFSASKISCREVRIQAIYSNSNRWEIGPQQPTIDRPVSFSFADEFFYVPRVEILALDAGGSSSGSAADFRVSEPTRQINALIRISTVVEFTGNLTTAQIGQIQAERKKIRTLFGERCRLTSARGASATLTSGDLGFRINYEWTLDGGGFAQYDSDPDIVDVPAREGYYNLRWDEESETIVQEENPHFDYANKTSPPATLPGNPITTLPS
jgi:hypothetical protein